MSEPQIAGVDRWEGYDDAPWYVGIVEGRLVPYAPVVRAES